MVMFVRMAAPLPLIFLLMIHGVFSESNKEEVTYSHSYICALKGSSVIMSCTYKYPNEYQITKAFWTKTLIKGKEPPDLSEDPEYSQRIQYLGDKQKNCTLKLNNVQQKDEHMYYFRFISNKDKGKYTGTPGVTLDVTDLQVETPERVKEGDSVTLTCETTCSLTDTPTFIWYRNTQILTEGTNKLFLQPVRREDAGSYSCAVQRQNLTSPAVTLSVTYPPKNAVISISQSDLMEGDSVTLTCSSDANPPANIRWYKEETFLKHGENYTITNISSDHSGEYKCTSSYDQERKSDAVTLNVMYPPRNVSVSISGIQENSSVILTCSSDSNPPVLNYTWFKESEASPVGSGQSYRALQSGRFYCEAQNKYGSGKSSSVALTGDHISVWHVAFGITVGCGGFFIIFIILFIMKKRRDAKTEDPTVKQDDAQYASVLPRSPRDQTESRDTEEVQYATVKHHRNKEKKRPEENETLYDNITIHQPDAAVRCSNVQKLEDASVIYSSVTK